MFRAKNRIHLKFLELTNLMNGLLLSDCLCRLPKTRVVFFFYDKLNMCWLWKCLFGHRRIWSKLKVAVTTYDHQMKQKAKYFHKSTLSVLKFPWICHIKRNIKFFTSSNMMAFAPAWWCNIIRIICSLSSKKTLRTLLRELTINGAVVEARMI